MTDPLCDFLLQNTFYPLNGTTFVTGVVDGRGTFFISLVLALAFAFFSGSFIGLRNWHRPVEADLLKPLILCHSQALRVLDPVQVALEEVASSLGERETRGQLTQGEVSRRGCFARLPNQNR